MKQVINWNLLQEAYDAGLSYRELCKKFNVPDGQVYAASKRGDLILRDKRSAKLLADANGKGYKNWSEESKKSQKDKVRSIAISRHSNGWDNKAGRCKKYKYSSYIAGDVTVDGTWELAVAQWLDLKKYNWKRNKNRFSYKHLNGHTANYTPDFWVEELGGYLEVKGYETKLDRCKWSQFTENLVVWKKKDLKALGLL